MPPLLYSTNPYLKFFINMKFYDDVHYVWCSEHFNSELLGAYTIGRRIPASSNPSGIYRRLKQDVESKDDHSAKIAEQRASYLALAEKFKREGRIEEEIQEEISYIVKEATFDDWRPLIYVIPRDLVTSRMQLVPVERRAGFGDEYIVPDLARAEFDIVEV